MSMAARWSLPLLRSSARPPVVALPVVPAAASPLLSVTDLEVQFAGGAGRRPVRAVDGVSFQIERGKTLAVVGESGSGKSVTSLAILGLLPREGRMSRGSIVFNGSDLALRSPGEMRRLRGAEIGMIFQEPMTSLNPVRSVGEQITERIRTHSGLGPAAAWKQAVEMLELVRIPEPWRRATCYPHQMSGGMRQRVMIAMALACRPKLLIADEPTTALDVTIQAQILDLMRKLQKEFGMAILFITHDLGVVAEMADRVVVMYAGRSVEEASVEEIFQQPRMPYTRALLRSIPAWTARPCTRSGWRRLPAVFPIPGSCLRAAAFTRAAASPRRPASRLFRASKIRAAATWCAAAGGASWPPRRTQKRPLHDLGPRACRRAASAGRAPHQALCLASWLAGARHHHGACGRRRLLQHSAG